MLIYSDLMKDELSLNRNSSCSDGKVSSYVTTRKIVLHRMSVASGGRLFPSGKSQVSINLDTTPGPKKKLVRVRGAEYTERTCVAWDTCVPKCQETVSDDQAKPKEPHMLNDAKAIPAKLPSKAFVNSAPFDQPRAGLTFVSRLPAAASAPGSRLVASQRRTRSGSPFAEVFSRMCAR